MGLCQPCSADDHLHHKAWDHTERGVSRKGQKVGSREVECDCKTGECRDRLKLPTLPSTQVPRWGRTAPNNRRLDGR